MNQAKAKTDTYMQIDSVGIFISRQTRYSTAWASQQIRNIAGCAWTGNAGNVLPANDLERDRYLAIPACIDVRHACVVMHVGIANTRWQGKRSRHSRCMRNPQVTYLARWSLCLFLPVYWAFYANTRIVSITIQKTHIDYLYWKWDIYLMYVYMTWPTCNKYKRTLELQLCAEWSVVSIFLLNLFTPIS